MLRRREEKNKEVFVIPRSPENLGRLETRRNKELRDGYMMVCCASDQMRCMESNTNL